MSGDIIKAPAWPGWNDYAGHGAGHRNLSPQPRGKGQGTTLDQLNA